MATYTSRAEAEEAISAAVAEHDPERKGDKWRIACPLQTHAESGSNQGGVEVSIWDRKPGDFVIRAKCYAGCESREVRRALGLWQERTRPEPDIVTDFVRGDGTIFRENRANARDGREKQVWFGDGHGNYQGSLKGVKPKAFGEGGTLLIVEGVKCALIASRIDGIQAATWPGGTKKQKYQTREYWQELADGKERIVGMGDNDVDGQRMITHILGLIQHPDIRVVDVSGLPVGGSIDDVDSDTAVAMIDAAMPFKPTSRTEAATTESIGYELRYNGEDDWAEVRFDGGDWQDIRKSDWPHIANMHEDANKPFATETELHWATMKTARRNMVFPERDRLTELAQQDFPGAIPVKEVLYHLFEVDEVMPVELVEYASMLLVGGSIQRRLVPGCKLDNVPILVGPQGIGKSQLLRMLTRERVYEYTNPVRDMTAKMLIENTKGVAIVELAEFKPSALELNRFKGVVSQQVDTDREAWGRAVSRKPRSFAFVGTTNQQAVIPPDDSNRRFVMVKLLAARLNESDTYYCVLENLDAWEAECARYVLAGNTYAMPQSLSAVNADIANTQFVNVDDWWVKAVSKSEPCKRAVALGYQMSLVEIWQSALDAMDADPERNPYNRSYQRLTRALAYLGWTNSGRRRNGDGDAIVHYSPPEVAGPHA